LTLALLARVDPRAEAAARRRRLRFALRFALRTCLAAFAALGLAFRPAGLAPARLVATRLATPFLNALLARRTLEIA
jgi:hypothetical protein